MKTNYIKIVDGSYSIHLAMLFLVSFVFCAVSLLNINSNQLGGVGWAQQVSFVFFIWAAFYVTFTYLHYKTVYLYSNAYVLCLAIFHLGMTVQMAFGMEIGGWSRGSFSYWLEMSAWLTNVAFSGFGMGLSFSQIGAKSKYMDSTTASKKIKLNKGALYWSGMGLMLAAAIFMALAIASYGNIFSYARHELFGSSADSRGWGLFTMIFPGAAALLFFGASNRKQSMTAIAFVVIAVSFFMFTGYRSAALFMMLSATITWVKIGRKLPLIIALLLLFVTAISVSIFGYLRTTGAYNEIDADDFKKSYEEASISSVGRLGQTLGLVAHSLRLVPEEFPSRHGGSYLLALRQAIPNIGLKIDAETGRFSAKQRLAEDKLAIYKIAPSDWMTYEVLNEQYDIGGGVGFSGVAEPYINFGVFGVIVFFFITGVGLGKLDSRFLPVNLYHFIFVLCMFNHFMPTVRNDFSNFIKPAFFTLIILSIWWFGSRIVFGRKLPK